jgi:oligoribonuclease
MALEKWHQDTYGPTGKGGNGLFDDVIKSKVTKDEVEEQFLSMLKLFCLEKECYLAGSSIHTDKQVLERCMPKVHDYLHYRIIDVTSFQGIMKRWEPDLESRIKRRLRSNEQTVVTHRAMDDILWSISYMAQIRSILFKNW